MSEEIKNLDENQVTKDANPGDKAIKKLENDGSGLSPQDLGGPTPQNSKPTDDSNKFKIIAGGNAVPPSTKPSAASAQTATFSDKGDVKAGHEPEGDVIAEAPAEEVTTEKEEEKVLEIDLSADVAALTEGEDLSAEFKDKAKTIFEAAVVSRLNEELERMHTDYAKVLEEEVESVKTKLAEQVDEYLSYSVTQWMDKNELAIEHGIKVEMAESVLAGLKQVFSENYIEISDEKVDLVDEMTEQLDVMEKKLNDQIEQNVSLVKELGGFTKNGIVSEVAEGLSLTQKEKLQSLAEAVEFEDESSYREKVTTLRESYFSTKPEVTSTELTEDVKVENQDIAPGMDAYVQALSRWSAKSN
tara:strand:- start:647 stop:1720 length:1074 start_codon:yes stop_codon:yes gene_type:complete